MARTAKLMCLCTESPSPWKASRWLWFFTRFDCKRCGGLVAKSWQPWTLTRGSWGE